MLGSIVLLVQVAVEVHGDAHTVDGFTLAVVLASIMAFQHIGQKLALWLTGHIAANEGTADQQSLAALSGEDG